MPVSIGTTAEITAQNITNFETRLGQTIPINDKAFINVLSAIEGGLATLHNKYAVDRILQTLALTATEEDLDRIGINYGVFRVASVSSVALINQPAAIATSIPVSIAYVSDSNSIRYINNATVVAGGAGADLEVVCEVAGADGNLTAGDTLTIERQVAGITSTTAAYTSTVTTGIDRESDEVYRRRVLQEIRTVGGGGNGVDYRTWSEALAAVYRTFPFSGAPVTFTKKLKDGDMELSTVANWEAGNSASLQKSAAAPHGGTYALLISDAGFSDPYAYQYSLEKGRDYTVSGWARSVTGGATPVVKDGTTVLWTGTTSMLYQYFSVLFIAANTDLRFGSVTAGDSSTYFDDCTLEVVDSLPGDRTIYVEVLPAIDADGIPTQLVLDAVRTLLTTDPVTGKARMVLGTTDEKMFVEPIVRSELDVEITGLVVDSAQLVALKASLDTGVDQYFRTVSPFVTGVDSALDRSDVITGIVLSEVVQDILNAYSASAEEIAFNKVGSPATTRYQIAENETAKLGTITYV